MINLNFNLYNPWSRRRDVMLNRFLWFKHGTLTKHKAWEFCGYATHHIIDFYFNLTFKGDHAGLQSQFGLLGYSIEFSIYDTRHWDYDTDTWEKYDGH